VKSRRLAPNFHGSGFPSSFLARSDNASFAWRRNFVQTFVERDLPQLGVRIPAPTLSRFWAMLAHYHAQIWNGSEFARSFGVSDKTVRHYLDMLASAFVVQVLPPWHANLGKRQVKSPKVYIRDSGLLHTLLLVRAFRGGNRPPVGARPEAVGIRIQTHVVAGVEPLADERGGNTRSAARVRRSRGRSDVSFA